MALPAAMQQVIDEGYFERVKTGDLRAASYFARLVAYRMNPTGAGGLPGALTKPAGGSNVEGYADDAIVLNSDPHDLFNVVDLVAGSGAPNASPSWNGPLPRRASDKWEAPKPLTTAQMTYLRPGGGPVDPPPPPPAKVPEYEAIGGDTIFRQKVGAGIVADYAVVNNPMDDGVAVWFARPIYDAIREMVLKGTDPLQAIEAFAKKHRNAMRKILDPTGTKLPPL